jgi:hypothetical protein
MTNAVNLASAAGTGFTLRNRIINGGFDVWQRGISGFSTSTGTYTADRWRNDQTITVVQSSDVPNVNSRFSLDVTQGSTSYGTFVQRIEVANCFDLVGKQVTLSFWAKSISGSVPMNVLLRYAGSSDNFTSPVNIQAIGSTITTSWAYYTFTFNALPSQVANGLEVCIYRDLGSAQTRYSQIQLEVGSVATPFERRPYGLELALCQRYCELASSAPGRAYSGTAAEFHMTYKVTKRAAPTIAINPNGQSNVHQPGVINTSASFQYSFAVNETHGSFGLNNMSGLVSGSYCGANGLNMFLVTSEL